VRRVDPYYSKRQGHYSGCCLVVCRQQNGNILSLCVYLNVLECINRFHNCRLDSEGKVTLSRSFRGKWSSSQQLQSGLNINNTEHCNLASSIIRMRHPKVLLDLG